VPSGRTSPIPHRLKWSPGLPIVFRNSHLRRIKSGKQNQTFLSFFILHPVNCRYFQRCLTIFRHWKPLAPGEAAICAFLHNNGAPSMSFGIKENNGFVILQENRGGITKVLFFFFIRYDLSVCSTNKTNMDTWWQKCTFKQIIR